MRLTLSLSKVLATRFHSEGCPLLSGLVQCFLSQLLLIDSDGNDGFEMLYVINWEKRVFFVFCFFS